MPRGWEIWVDTGGTFTDAIGVDPSGRWHRAKILSTSALRGVVEQAAGTRLMPRRGWDLPAGFLKGFRFRLLGRPGDETRVIEFRPDPRTLVLDRAPGKGLVPGAAFEVVSDEEAPVLAARILTRTPPGRPLPVAAMRLGTTLATNALLERRGLAPVFFTTRGFADLLVIGTQQRPDLFALDIRRPDPLYREVIEVGGRMASDGAVLEPLDAARVAAEAARLAGEGVRGAAVALLNAWRNPVHETQVSEILRACGFTHVSLSSELSPTIGFLQRGETAVVDAYLAPVVRGYFERVGGSLPGGRLHVMTSAGGLAASDAIRPKDTLLSGPAGGVVGAAEAGRGAAPLIGFDMGGTSTDVARIPADYEYVFEHQVGDAHLAAPALAIETVAAGGGSVCWFDGDRLRVGPRSAGASPGPACYGAGGPLTLTDVNLLLGRLDPAFFEIPIDATPAAAALDLLRREVERRTRERPTAEAILSGFLDIADERMADAIRAVSLRRGHDPAGHTLVAFGGAGGQHACGVAARLGLGRIIVPYDAGLLSARGLGHALLERFAEEQILMPLEAIERDGSIARVFARLEARAAAALVAEGVEPTDIRTRRRVARLRFAGQDSAVDVEYRPGRPLRPAFIRRYVELYGHRPERRAIEVESIRVAASNRPSAPPRTGRPPRPFPATPAGTRRAWAGSRHAEVPVHDREALLPGAGIEGPALIFEARGSTFVASGWRARVDGDRALILTAAATRGPGKRSAPRAATPGLPRNAPGVVRLELFTSRLRAVASEMGERLRRTAVSTNIKERLDFSCAVLDARGDLVVNAPHIPVHLGGLGMCVRALRAAIEMEPGDVVVTNHPAFGGSHLPDVTVVTPVFAPAKTGPDVRPGHAMRGARGGRRRGGGSRSVLIGYVASRAHHAEIGGSRPGSMPPGARTLAEEGVLIPPAWLVRRGRPRWEPIRRRLLAPPFPTRAIEDNLADLRAAAAANHAGAALLRALAEDLGTAAVAGLMDDLKGLAERRTREALSAMPDGVYEARESLDDGSLLSARLTLRGGRATLDFAGTADVHPGNLNATPAIVRSVVMYVLRLLLRDPLPLNEGLLQAVALDLPRGLLNPAFPDDPARAPAIVGGNVETSQRLVDTLLKALRLAACSQGTMNNVLFGDDRFGYYETIGGGAGAGPGFRGASGVHSHMTNTRITDVEVLEHRYPIRVERFTLRRDSGGEGRYRGGDGIVRALRFLSSVSISLLGQHRAVPPYGLEGGGPGLPGAQRLVRADGGTVELPGAATCEARAGDLLVIETPGGGGYGRAEGPA